MLLYTPVILLVAGLVATLFTAWTEPSIPFAAGTLDPQQLILTPIPQPEFTPTLPYAPEVGLVAGHYGNDSGAVCPDGLREVDINLNIATLVQKMLTQRGVKSEILQEFDPKLNGYRATLLLSIHADSCAYINDEASGYKVAAALMNSQPEKSARLVNCLRSHYAITTGLKHHKSVTLDMTYYHAFNEIHPETVAAIIEVGFMNLDRVLLTQKPELVASGITNGILCYLNNEPIPTVPSP
ncbi:MAG: N-acetylmuramoyl-L-alanine amidase [Anaerolineales bacterium]|nr:N-acetylmuramoyl-L-alanine amidase [Anaerolineales bacterium]MDW8446694.1 N-acetylmuramoyl-L-alanine amidase [Anaerolineales bacterium]